MPIESCWSFSVVHFESGRYYGLNWYPRPLMYISFSVTLMVGDLYYDNKELVVHFGLRMDYGIDWCL